jgi:hypothetical protein
MNENARSDAVMLSLALHGVCKILNMRTVTLPLPEFGFVVATRAALAAGLGLLFAGRLSPQRRRIVGLALVVFGAATTVPAVRWMSRTLRNLPATSRVESDPRLIGATRFPRKGDDEIEF